jgi:hypothetical protein
MGMLEQIGGGFANETIGVFVVGHAIPFIKEDTPLRRFWQVTIGRIGFLSSRNLIEISGIGWLVDYDLATIENCHTLLATNSPFAVGQDLII